MLKSLHSKKRAQLFIGLIIGILFGFLLQKGGVTKYDVIISQLLLKDFTVVKIMLTAVIVGMIGIHFMKNLGLVQLHPKPGSVGMSVIGGLIFGAGFAVLGYCPGTIAGAVGQGSIDALIGGVVGIILGSGIFASMYPKLQEPVLMKNSFGELTLPQLFKVNEWIVVIPFVIVITIILWLLENAGL
ncbi:YeeE/YedE family protein [Candidatus Poribacteria bacterium]|nr:YeeE/YedE family protein [Candidatus Poribacteria bacterium]